MRDSWIGQKPWREQMRYFRCLHPLIVTVLIGFAPPRSGFRKDKRTVSYKLSEGIWSFGKCKPIFGLYYKTALYARKGGHTRVLNFFNSQKESDPRQLAQVKSWVSQAFDLSEDVSVLITQLQCTEEGCPPIETVIAIMETPGKPRQYKIHKPLAEVKQTDIVSLTAG